MRLPLQLIAAALLIVATALPAAARHHKPGNVAPKQPAPLHKPAPHVDNVLVWVDLATDVYYLPGDGLWGHTLSGQYMSESEADADGYRQREINE